MTKTRFAKIVGSQMSKDKVSTLQLNLGRKCNQRCLHCHIEAGPDREEEISKEVKDKIIEVIRSFKQIEVIDITGGAPEYHFGFKDIVKEAKRNNKRVIVRSNLTIFFEEGYRDLPEFFEAYGVEVVASMPCYLAENVDAMRGKGVYDKSIEGLKLLNMRGYGSKLVLNLVYNPAMPSDNKFGLAPAQKGLEAEYKKRLKADFAIDFNSLYVFNNVLLGRYEKYLRKKNLDVEYLNFLESHFNKSTLPHLMCKNQLSINYEGKIFDCDFNLISKVHCKGEEGQMLTIDDVLKHKSVDIVKGIEVRDYCFACTAGAGSSCSGALFK